jgi:hypothetical protein
LPSRSASATAASIKASTSFPSLHGMVSTPDLGLAELTTILPEVVPCQRSLQAQPYGRGFSFRGTDDQCSHRVQCRVLKQGEDDVWGRVNAGISLILCVGRTTVVVFRFKGQRY